MRRAILRMLLVVIGSMPTVVVAQFEDGIQRSLEAQIRQEELTTQLGSGRTGEGGMGAPNPTSDDDGEDDSGDSPRPLGVPGDDDDDIGAPPAKKDVGGVVVWLPKPAPLPNHWAPDQPSLQETYERHLREWAASRQRFEAFMLERWENVSHPVIDRISQQLGELNDGFEGGTVSEEEFLKGRGTLMDALDQARSIANDDALNPEQRDRALNRFARNNSFDITAAYEDISLRPFLGADLDDVPDSAFTGKIYTIQDWWLAPFSHSVSFIQDPTANSGWRRVEVGGPGLGLSVEGAKALTVGSSKLNFTIKDQSVTAELGEWDPKTKRKVGGDKLGDFATLFVTPEVHRRLLKRAFTMQEESKKENWYYHVLLWTDRAKQCATIYRDWMWGGGVHLPDNTIAGFDLPMFLPDAIRDYNNGLRAKLETGSWQSRLIKFGQSVLWPTKLIIGDVLETYDESGDLNVQGLPERPWIDTTISPPVLPPWLVDRTRRLKNVLPKKETGTPADSPPDIKFVFPPFVLFPEDTGAPVAAGEDESDPWNEWEWEQIQRMMAEIDRQRGTPPQDPLPTETPRDPILFDAERDRDVEDPIPYDPIDADSPRWVLDQLDPTKSGLLLSDPKERNITLSPIDYAHPIPENVSRLLEHLVDTDEAIRPLLNIAEDIEGEALATLVVNRLGGSNKTDDLLPPVITPFGKPREDDCPVPLPLKYNDQKALKATKKGGRFLFEEMEVPNKRTVANSAVPDDRYCRTSGSWGQSGRDQWALERIGMLDAAAGRLADTNRRVWRPCVVAVIDTGAELSHSDLTGQLWRNLGEIPFNGLDDDRNGYVDDVYGYNTLEDSPNVLDDNGHGTHVAGIIGANWDGEGVAGASPECSLMIVKAFDRNGRTDPIRLALGIRYAVLNGANIVQISAENNEPSEIEEAIVHWATRKGVLVIVSSGSRGRNTAGITPARIDGVLTVGAVDRDDKQLPFSGWGRHVDLVAPGVDILSLRARDTDFMFTMAGKALGIKENERVVDERWYRADGTSFSAPFVTGVAAALWARNPELTAEQIKNKLIMSCDDVEQPGWDVLTGAGRLNAAKALGADPDQFLSTKVLKAEIVRSNGRPHVSVSGEANGEDYRRRSLQIAFGREPAEDDWVTVQTTDDAVQDGLLGLIPGRSFTQRGPWSIRSVVEDRHGNTRSSSMIVRLE